MPTPPWGSWSAITTPAAVSWCIASDHGPGLQAAIRGKGYPLVGTDFLTFWPDEKYDLILMNPPFASGVRT